jgi:hypothetical protein
MLVDDCIAGFILGASLGGLAGAWTNPAAGMILGADIGVAIMLIWHVLESPSITDAEESLTAPASAGI